MPFELYDENGLFASVSDQMGGDSELAVEYRSLAYDTPMKKKEKIKI